MKEDKSKTLFDNWATSYEHDVSQSNEQGEYPFAGYKTTTSLIVDFISTNNLNTVVDMGIGTGYISKQLYDKDHFIIGVDFSTKMIDHSYSIMPNAKYINADFDSAVQYMKNNTIDCFIFSYSIHHLSPYKQYHLLRLLDYKLKKGGVIIIGDVMRNTKEELTQLQDKYKVIWDDEESYPVHEEYKRNLYDAYKITYIETSHVSGILLLQK